MERVSPPDVHAAIVDLDDVVTGARVSSQAQATRPFPAFTTKRSSSRQTYGHVLVTGQHEPDAGSLEALDRVARVVDDVALAPGAGNRKQMVVKHEDLEVCRLGELLLDPA